MKHKNLLLLLILTLFMTTVSEVIPQDEAEKKAYRELPSGTGPLSKQVSVYELPNGMRILMLERHRTPIVTFMIWYRVGSVNEVTGKTGMSHFLEHMMFKGTAECRPGEIDLLTMRAGGRNNAATSYDYTCYYFDLAADRWELALEIESDRIRNADFAPEQFESERQVVLSELDGGWDSPWERLYIETHACSYLAHPYRTPIIGHKSDVQNLSRDEMLRYYRTYYAPNNATVVMAGDFDRKEAIEKIAAAFGSIPRGPVVPKIVTTEPAQEGQRRVTVVEDAAVARVKIVFHTVSLTHQDDITLEVISRALSGGKSSRLYRRLVDRDRLTTGVWSYEDSRRYAGQFEISAELRPHVKSSTVEETVFEELEVLAKKGLSEKELTKARNIISAEFVFGNERISDLAYNLGYYETVASYKKLDTYLDDVARVTLEDIKRVASKYFTRENSTVGLSLPRNTEAPGSGQGFAHPAGRKEAARGGHRVPAAMKQNSGPPGGLASALAAESVRLPNGMLVMLREDHAVPLIALQAWVEAGWMCNPPGKEGLSNLVGEMLAEGTDSRNHEKIVAEIEFVGGQLRNSGTGVKVKVLKKDRELAFDIASDMLKESTFPAERFEFQKSRILAQIQADSDEPRTRARLAFYEMVFGKHPYHAPSIGTEDSVKKLTREDAVGFYKSYYVPSNVILSVVGDFDTAEVKGLVSKYFGGWKEGKAPELKLTDVPYGKGEVRRIHAPTEQSYIYMGHRGIPRANPDYYALLVMDYVLGTGPGFTSRIIKRLREKEGLAYEVWAYLAESSGLQPGWFMVYAGCAAENTDRMLLGLKEEIEGIRKEHVSSQELSDAKKYLTGSFVFQYETDEQIAGELIHAHRYNLGSDYIERFPKLVEAVTADDVLRVAGKYLRPDALRIAICGPGGKAQEKEGE